jgi:aryl-alcohol dehydrogenase-like predicted oxidoreductase
LTELIPGRATASGTKAFARRFAHLPGHFRERAGLSCSSIGLGTYLGRYDDQTDAAYTDAAVAALNRGCNVLDTAINYRCMRSERALGVALRRVIDAGKLRREEVVVATKGGFVPFDGAPPADPQAYASDTYVATGIMRPDELVAGCHCMTPDYLADQIRRSRENLGLAMLDVYYLHNPETQKAELDASEFWRRIRAAFELLEAKVATGDLGVYGVATWDALRAEPSGTEYLSLAELVQHFRAIQLPLNLAMPEAFANFNQLYDDRGVSTLTAAEAHGLLAMASASISQGRLTRGLPKDLQRVFPGLQTDAQRALQFTRSAPGLITALVGMSRLEHVTENLATATIAPASEQQILHLFQG